MIPGAYIGFWNFAEIKSLQTSLLTQFGTIQEVQQRFWTEEEKHAFNNRESSSGLQNHAPISTGIECVLQTLEKVAGIGTDLCFYVG